MAFIREWDAFEEAIMKKEDKDRGNSLTENTQQEQREENTDEKLRGEKVKWKEGSLSKFP